MKNQKFNSKFDAKSSNRIEAVNTNGIEAFLELPFFKSSDEDFQEITEGRKISIFSSSKKDKSFKSEDLPETFKNRTFIKNLAAIPYKLEELPGHIVKYDDVKKDFIIVSLSRYVIDNEYPETVVIEDGILYSSKVNAEAYFNGSFLIGGLSVEHNSIMELIIQDVMYSIIPEDLIWKDELKKKVGEIDKNELNKYFFIRGTLLTIINNKKFKSQKFDAKVNTTYVTIDGDVFASNEKFSRERLISIDLVPLNSIL